MRRPGYAEAMPTAPKAKDKRGSVAGGELAIIERIRRRARAAAGRGGELQLGIGDDCAILWPRRGSEIVVTTDFSLEGRHFRRDWHSPESIGHRTLARGLSDLAAMGARPIAAFLSLALPKSAAGDQGWLDSFLSGLLALADRVKVPLAGGDTSESPSEHVLADIVLIGTVPRGRALRRDGARVGDRIFVTGSLGGASAELQSLAPGKRADQPTQPSLDGRHPHLFPEPRLQVGQSLLRRALASAAMDLSDGLSSDLHRLCESSCVAAEVDSASLPRHELLEGLGEERSLAAALHGGEDYELLFTTPFSQRTPKRLAGVPVTEIGRIIARRRGRPLVTLIDARGRSSALKPQGWEHLR